MNRCCSHCHGRFDGFLSNAGRLFWALVATAAGMWLILAMEMLRRSRPQWEPGSAAEQNLLPASDNPPCGHSAGTGRGHDR